MVEPDALQPAPRPGRGKRGVPTQNSGLACRPSVSTDPIDCDYAPSCNGCICRSGGAGRHCNLESLKGTYRTLLSGTKPSGPPPAPLEQLIGVALTTFDGQGHSVGIDNIHAAISGVTLDRQGIGTYTINENCSGTAFLFNLGVCPWK